MHVSLRVLGVYEVFFYTANRSGFKFSQLEMSKQAASVVEYH